MYKEVLRSIEGVGLYPAITLVTFVLFFVMMLLRVAAVRGSHAVRMGAMPLQDGTEESQTEAGGY